MKREASGSHPTGFNASPKRACRLVAYKFSGVGTSSYEPQPASSLSTLGDAACLGFPPTLRWIQLPLSQGFTGGILTPHVHQLGDRHLQFLGELEQRFQAGVALTALKARQETEGERSLGEVLLR
jgi:hypothetical protein